MSSITNPSLYRIARQSGVKTMSSDCPDVLRKLLTMRADEICRAVIILNTQSGTKTIMPNDVYSAMSRLGVNLTQSDTMGETTCPASGC